MEPSLLADLQYAGPILLQSIVEEQPEALTAVGLLLLGIGLVNIYLDRSKKATAGRLQEANLTDINSITDGLVAVSGVARPAEETLERPASDGECLAYERRTVTKKETIERSEEDGEAEDVDFETTVSSMSKSTAFYVEDDTGSVLVADRETPTLHLETTDSETEKTDPAELAEKRRELESRLTRDSNTVVTEQNHTYSELLPGDEVFVYGQGSRRATEDITSTETGTTFQITEEDESGDFIVTHHDKDWIVERYTSNVQLLIGLVVSVLSSAFLLYIWMF